MNEICVNKYDAGGGGARAVMSLLFFYSARLCMNLFAIVVQLIWVGRQTSKQAGRTCAGECEISTYIKTHH